MMASDFSEFSNNKPLVIVVEDDESMNRLLQRIIARAGFKVTGATNGKQGISLIESAQNGFLVLDFFLPDMNGMEFIEALKNSHLDIPYIILTAHGDEQIAVDMMKSGALDYVMKSPNLFETIPNILGNALDKVETARKLKVAELELRRANEQLEEKVRARTTELSEANEKLKQTMADLERSNRELELFAYHASHDLKEPIRKVLAFGKLLKEKIGARLDADSLENLEYLIDGAERMMKMIDGLLSYSRVTSKSAPFEEADLGEIVSNVVKFDIAERIAETGGKVEVVGQLPRVNGDRIQLHQLLQNLISNGLKFHRNNIPPNINISAAQSNGHVEIDITDNGIGIDEAENDVFSMFTRLDTRFEGSGIGLAVCKKIVERHGGKIGHRANPDGGTVFWFTLPSYANQLTHEGVQNEGQR